MTTCSKFILNISQKIINNRSSILTIIMITMPINSYLISFNTTDLLNVYWFIFKNLVFPIGIIFKKIKYAFCFCSCYEFITVKALFWCKITLSSAEKYLRKTIIIIIAINIAESLVVLSKSAVSLKTDLHNKQFLILIKKWTFF